MSFDPKTGGPCAVADIRRGALRDIAQVLQEHQKRKHPPKDDGLEAQLLPQLEGLAIGLEQRGEKSAAHIIRAAIKKLS